MSKRISKTKDPLRIERQIERKVRCKSLARARREVRESKISFLTVMSLRGEKWA